MIDFSKLEEEDIYLSPIQKALVTQLQKKGPMTRAEMVKVLSKARTVIYDNLIRLMDHKLVKRYSRPTNSRGRPQVLFKVIEAH